MHWIGHIFGQLHTAVPGLVDIGPAQTSLQYSAPSGRLRMEIIVGRAMRPQKPVCGYLVKTSLAGFPESRMIDRGGAMADPESSFPAHPTNQLRSLTEIPLRLPGRIFRCSMPFSPYDPDGHTLQAFRHQEISVIVLLAEADECLTMTGRDLPGLYQQEGFQVLHLPIPDGSIPSKDELEDLVTAVIQHAQAGEHVAIHCYAGIGRTGLVAAAMAKRLLGMHGEAAIAWVRRYIPRAVETLAQRRLLVDDDPES
jgi:hypothetical protein